MGVRTKSWPKCLIWVWAFNIKVSPEFRCYLLLWSRTRFLMSTHKSEHPLLLLLLLRLFISNYAKFGSQLPPGNYRVLFNTTVSWCTSPVYSTSRSSGAQSHSMWLQATSYPPQGCIFSPYLILTHQTWIQFQVLDPVSQLSFNNFIQWYSYKTNAH